jgi:hypothetical protein
VYMLQIVCCIYACLVRTRVHVCVCVCRLVVCACMCVCVTCEWCGVVANSQLGRQTGSLINLSCHNTLHANSEQCHSPSHTTRQVK